MAAQRFSNGRQLRERIDLLNAPEYEAAAKKEYLNNADLQNEFRSFGSFYAYKRYVAAGGTVPVKKDSSQSVQDQVQQHLQRGREESASAVAPRAWAELTEQQQAAIVQSAGQQIKKNDPVSVIRPVISTTGRSLSPVQEEANKRLQAAIARDKQRRGVK